MRDISGRVTVLYHCYRSRFHQIECLNSSLLCHIEAEGVVVTLADRLETLNHR